MQKVVVVAPWQRVGIAGAEPEMMQVELREQRRRGQHQQTKEQIAKKNLEFNLKNMREEKERRVD